MIGKLSCSWICEYIEKKGYPWQWRRKMYIPGIPSYEKEGHRPFCYCLLPTPTLWPGISVPDPTITRQPHTPQITLQTQFSIILWPYSLLRPSWWTKPALNNSYWYFWSQLGFTGEVLRWKFACKKNSGKYCWDQQSWDCEGNKTELREARLWCSHKGPADGTELWSGDGAAAASDWGRGARLLHPHAKQSLHSDCPWRGSLLLGEADLFS